MPKSYGRTKYVGRTKLTPEGVLRCEWSFVGVGMRQCMRAALPGVVFCKTHLRMNKEMPARFQLSMKRKG